MINKIAIGTAQFGMDYGIANKIGEVSQSEINSILNFALINKINTIDTAKSYGLSEEKLGYYFKENNHDYWDIITKINDANENILTQIEDSKNRLSITPSTVLAHNLKTFLDRNFQKFYDKVKKENYKYKIGVSVYSEKEIEKIITLGFKPDIIQLPLNILDTRLYRNGVLINLYQENIEIHARSVFLQGIFYLSESNLLKNYPDVVPYLKKLKKIAIEAGISLAQLSLLWLLNLNEIGKIIIGVDSLNQLKQHVKTVDIKIEGDLFNQALEIKYENDRLLNPSLWN